MIAAEKAKSLRPPIWKGPEVDASAPFGRHHQRQLRGRGRRRQASSCGSARTSLSPRRAALQRAGRAAGRPCWPASRPPWSTSEPGRHGVRFIEGRTYEAPTSCQYRPAPAEVVALVKRCHREMPKHLRGPVLMFWVFHVLRDYAHVMRDGNSRSLGDLERYMPIAEILEGEIGHDRSGVRPPRSPAGQFHR